MALSQTTARLLETSRPAGCAYLSVWSICGAITLRCLAATGTPLGSSGAARQEKRCATSTITRPRAEGTSNLSHDTGCLRGQPLFALVAQVSGPSRFRTPVMPAESDTPDNSTLPRYATEVPPVQSLTTATHLVGTITVVTVAGEIDMATAPDLIGVLRDAANDAEHGLIVDLTPLTFLASAGMSALVYARGLARAGGIGFAVVAAGPATTRPLQLMELTEMLGVQPSLDHALTTLIR